MSEITTSPSDINLWKAEPALALMKHHFGLRSLAGPKAIRGTAVHAAAQEYLHKGCSWDEAEQTALYIFDMEMANLRQQAAGEVFADEEDAKSDVIPMMVQAIQALEPLGQPESVEEEIRLDMGGIVLRGFVDFDFGNFQLDLKTGARAYQKPTPDHLTQLACYWGMSGQDQMICYATAKKHQVVPVSEFELEAEWKLVERLVKKIRLMKEMPFEEAKDLCPPQDFAGFRWDHDTRVRAVELWGL